jgi:hypothetical protein
MSRSEIFDEYARIAKEHGLLSEGWDASKRYDSNTLDAIEMLYGVKPENEKDMRELSDQAHPETIVAAPSYDAMNGVVENLYERQNMMRYIAEKVPDGHLIQRRYIKAYQELTNSLVRAGFTLDNNDELELMKLADSCNETLHKQGQGWEIGIGIGVAALVLGLIAAINRTSASAQGVENNCIDVIDEADDLESTPITREIIRSCQMLSQKAREFRAARRNVSYIKSAEDVIDATENPPEELRVAQEYLAMLQDAQQIMPRWITDIKSEEGVREESYIPDWLQKVVDVGGQAVSWMSGGTDVVNAIEGLQKSVKTAIDSVMSIIEKAKLYEPTLEELAAKRRGESPAESVNNPKENGGGRLGRRMEQAPPEESAVGQEYL